MIAAAFVAFVELLNRFGQRWDDALPGCLEVDISTRWHAALNGSRETRSDAQGHPVPPLTIVASYDGSPCGVITLTSGAFMAGTRDTPGAAERAFIKACKAAGPQRETAPPVSQPEQMPLGGLT